MLQISFFSESSMELRTSRTLFRGGEVKKEILSQNQPITLTKFKNKKKTSI